MNEIVFSNFKSDFCQTIQDIELQFPQQTAIIEILKGLKNKYFDEDVPTISQDSNTSGLSEDIADIYLREIEKNEDAQVMKSTTPKKKVKKNTNNQIKKNINQIEQVLKQSIIFNDVNEMSLQSGNINQCITSIKKLSSKIKSHGKQSLSCYAKIGFMLGRMREFEYANFMEHLLKNGINYSKSGVYSYIKFYKLSEKYKMVKNFSVSFHYISNNFPIIKEICIKNKW